MAARSICAVCGVEAALTKSGGIVKHGKNRGGGGQLKGDWCPGSGQPPKANPS